MTGRTHRLAVASLAILTAVALAGCGGGSDTADPQPSPAQPAPTSPPVATTSRPTPAQPTSGPGIEPHHGDLGPRLRVHPQLDRQDRHLLPALRPGRAAHRQGRRRRLGRPRRRGPGPQRLLHPKRQPPPARGGHRRPGHRDRQPAPHRQPGPQPQQPQGPAHLRPQRRPPGRRIPRSTSPTTTTASSPRSGSSTCREAPGTAACLQAAVPSPLVRLRLSPGNAQAPPLGVGPQEDHMPHSPRRHHGRLLSGRASSLWQPMRLSSAARRRCRTVPQRLSPHEQEGNLSWLRIASTRLRGG